MIASLQNPLFDYAVCLLIKLKKQMNNNSLSEFLNFNLDNLNRAVNHREGSYNSAHDPTKYMLTSAGHQSELAIFR